MTDDKNDQTGLARENPYRDGGPALAIRRGGPMFGNYDAAQKRKAPAWAAPLLSAAVVVHAILFMTMWVKSIWDLEQLDKPKNTLDLAFAPPPPPPPPPPPGGAKPHETIITPKKIKVKDIVQPVKMEPQQVKKVEDQGDPNGVEGGEVGGVAGGVVGGDPNGVLNAPPPPPPPPPPAAPQIVPPVALEQSRTAGDPQIHPDDVTKTEIQRSGKDKIVGAFKLCVSATGTVANITQIKSTGFGSYDSKILREMHGWRYRPFMVNDKAVPVCTSITFVYSQK